MDCFYPSSTRNQVCYSLTDELLRQFPRSTELLGRHVSLVIVDLGSCPVSHVVSLCFSLLSILTPALAIDLMAPLNIF